MQFAGRICHIWSRMSVLSQEDGSYGSTNFIAKNIAIGFD